MGYYGGKVCYFVLSLLMNDVGFVLNCSFACLFQGLPFFGTTFPGAVPANDEEKKKNGQIAKQVRDCFS